MPKRNLPGFSLLELLIAITIIGILAALGLGIYNAVYRASRDAKRQADLKLIQSALEQYHADQHYYPYQVTLGNPLTFGTRVYLTMVPKGPTNQDYAYEPKGTSCSAATPRNCTTYCLYTKLEGSVPQSDSGCSPPAILFPLNFGVTKP